MSYPCACGGEYWATWGPNAPTWTIKHQSVAGIYSPLIQNTSMDAGLLMVCPAWAGLPQTVAKASQQRISQPPILRSLTGIVRDALAGHRVACKCDGTLGLTGNLYWAQHVGPDRKSEVFRVPDDPALKEKAVEQWVSQLHFKATISKGLTETNDRKFEHTVIKVVRLLADHPRVGLIGSVTNCWLAGTPTDAQIVEWWAGSRTVDYVVPKGFARQVQGLVDGVVGEPLQWGSNVTRGKQSETAKWREDQTKLLSVAGQHVDTPQDILVTDTSDILANAKWVTGNELYEALPGAIQDARDGRLTKLNTCTPARWRALTRSIGQRRDWYGTAQVPPPPPKERVREVITGWRTFGLADTGMLAMGNGMDSRRQKQWLPILRGDRGNVWAETRYQATGLECGGNPGDPWHLEACKCGLYVQKLPRVNYGGRMVYAEAVIWGAVVEAEYGYRAEWAEIMRLYLAANVGEQTKRLAEQLSAVYGVPCHVPIVPIANWEHVYDPHSADAVLLADFLGVEEMFDDRRK